MVRLRPSSGQDDQNVTVPLHVVGPKSIIPEAVAVETKPSNTWLELLNDELKLGVTVDQGLYICSSSYCPTAPKDGQGWRAELTEPIEEFINKFERKRKIYRVRISFTYDLSDNNNQVQTTHSPVTPRAPTPAITTSRRGRSATSSISPARQPNIVISTDRGNSAVIPSTSSNCAPSSSTSSQNGCHLTRAQKAALRMSQDKEVGETSKLYQENGNLNGASQLAKRPKIENYAQTGVPSVPGPHVFVNDETLNSAQMLRIDNLRSLVKTECISEDYDEMEEDLDDEYELEEGEGEEERENIEEQNGRNEEEDVQDDQGQQNGEEDEFGRMSDEEDNAGDGLDNVEDNQVAEELRQLGIRFEDVKSGADRRFSGLSNAYMLRVQKEIRDLKKNKEWVDVFQRSPLAFYFVQEILKA